MWGDCTTQPKKVSKNRIIELICSYGDRMDAAVGRLGRVKVGPILGGPCGLTLGEHSVKG